MILNPAVEAVAREDNVMKIQTLSGYFWRRRSHSTVRQKCSDKVCRLIALSCRSRFQLPDLG
jgi:hypothetical protein